MATTPDAYRVPPTAASRPSKLILLVLAAVVVGFLFVTLTHKDEATPGAGSAPAASQNK
jgi:hypothetical protein